MNLNKNNRVLITLFFICYFNSFNFIYNFDYEFYVTKYPEIPKGIGAFFHYLNKGFKEGLQSAQEINNTNFDWQYYVKINNLNINNEKEAIEHYKKVGKLQGFEYCKRFKICVNLHLYNLNLLDEFARKINHFMKINDLNDFYIKVNIPVWQNINIYKEKIGFKAVDSFDCDSFNYIKNLAPYHSELITKDNYQVLGNIVEKVKSSFNLDRERIQVIFSENRGVDIGGFLLLVDQILQEDLDIDYVVVLHSKTHNDWREILTSILKLKVNNLLNYYEYIDGFSFPVFDPYRFPFFYETIEYFNLPKIDKFNFSLGTTFIASRKLIDFFKPYNILDIFDQLSFADAFHRDNKIEFNLDDKEFDSFNIDITRGITREHAYTRFLGYLITYLGLKVRVIDYIK